KKMIGRRLSQAEAKRLLAKFNRRVLHLQSWCLDDLISIQLAEARLQAIDDFRFEAAHMIRRFFAQATMKLFGQANTDHPTPGVLHQRKASDNYSSHQAENHSDEGGNCGAHGDTPPIRP